MRFYLSFFFTLVAYAIFSCTEIYKPELNHIPKVFVIEGLITNEQKNQSIYLSSAIPFDTLAKIPETGAIVFVTDNNGNKYEFKETLPGTYSSDYLEFIPKIGNKYTLTVESKNKIYKSSEQELLPVLSTFEVTNAYKLNRIYKYNGKLLLLSDVNGAEFIASIFSQSDSTPGFRFENTLLVEYTSIKEDDHILKYRWIKYNPNEYFNINNAKYNKSEKLQHDLGFCPLDTTFYGIITEDSFPPIGAPIPITTHKRLYGYIISFKQYHLNNDIYEYYKSLNKQLEAKQRFFDPISSQVIGNMTCISDPKEKVFGIFEASSVNLTTFKIDYNIVGNSYKLLKIPPLDMDSIPPTGENNKVPPKLWIY